MRFILLGLFFPALAWANPHPSGLPAPPVMKVAANLKDSRIPILKQNIQKYGLFQAYRDLAVLYEKAGYSADAARVRRQLAEAYRKKGLKDAGIIENERAAVLETDIRIYADFKILAQQAGSLYTRAALEPVTGCYLGAFIDRDDSLGPGFKDEGLKQTHRTPEQFAAKTGKNPASLFMYIAYGRPFPQKWVQTLKAANVIPHFAFEPSNLNQVQDDDYLRNFALACRAADWPIFIRFASEMNGSWTRYHGNPALYRQKFALVHNVLHRHAPRVATIWCVNNPPLGNIMSYYPGDANCDWVGVNFYSVPWHENDRSKPAHTKNPLALLDPVYKLFAGRKPIAICEYAASHQAKLDMKIIPEFTDEKISLLFGSLPLLYPRVKMVNWFNMNTIAYPVPGKTLNNYTLTGHPAVLGAWKRETDSTHYLTKREELGEPPAPVAKILNGQALSGRTTISVWAKTDSPRAKVFVALNNKIIFQGQKTGAFRFTLNCQGLRPGRHQLRAYVYTASNRFVGVKNANFKV